MKVSVLIDQLNALLNTHGDIEVFTHSFYDIRELNVYKPHAGEIEAYDLDPDEPCVIIEENN